MKQNNIFSEEDIKKNVEKMKENYRKYILENVDKLKLEFSNEDDLIKFKEKLNIVDELNNWCEERHYTLDELRYLLRFM